MGVQSNGGPTQTIALQDGSLAIGFGLPVNYPGTTTPITVDQRGTIRASTPDIGSFEYNVPAPAVTNVNPSYGSAAGGTMVTITGTNLTVVSAVGFGMKAVTSFISVTATQIVL